MACIVVGWILLDVTHGAAAMTEAAHRSPTQPRLPDMIMFVALIGALGFALYYGAQSMQYHWQWYRVPAFFGRDIDGTFILGPLLRGLTVTARIVACAIPITLILGLGTALLRLSRSWAAQAMARFYIEAIRNTPLLVQIYVFYFVLAPLLGLGRFWVGVLALSLFEASFAAEVIRGAILAVPRGQTEAARAMGLPHRQILRRVVLPQALPMMLPPLTGVLVNLIKHSAIVSVIAVADLATEGRNLISDTLMSFEVWLTIGALYLAATVPLAAGARWIERRVAVLR